MADTTRRSTTESGRAPRRVKKSRRRWRLFDRYTPRAVLVGVVAGLAIFVLLGLMVIGGGYGYFQVFQVIVPGVHVGDVRLGGMTSGQAALALNETWNIERGIIVTDGERSWYVPPADFGLSLDPVATAQQALNVGHGRGLFAEMFTTLDSILNGTAVAPVARVDSEVAREGLKKWADTINLPPQDASIRITDGQVVAMPGKPGYTLDVEGTLAVLVADPGLALMDGYLPLVLTPVAPRITDVGDAAAEAEKLLGSELTVQGYDPITDEQLQWTASREVIAAWLAVVDGEDGPRVIVSQERLADYLGGLGAQLGAGRYFDTEESAGLIEAALRGQSPTVGLTIHHPTTTYTVQPGDTLISISWTVGIPYWRILDANPGLDPDTLSVGQTLTIPSKSDLLPLPVVIGKRVVVSISQQRLWAYQDGNLLYEFVISTGIDRSPTQPGIFQVQEHDPMAYASVWDLTMPNFIGIYEAWPGFMNGFHGLPSRNGGQVLWAESLGRKSSFGCIILDLGDAEKLYNWAEDGVVVEIVE